MKSTNLSCLSNGSRALRLCTGISASLLVLGLGSVQVAATPGDCSEVLAALAADPAVANFQCFASRDLVFATNQGAVAPIRERSIPPNQTRHMT